MPDSPRPGAGATPPGEPILVYGNDHSPWVQAVLLGLHAAGTPNRLVAAPPFSVFRASGVLMPVVRLADGDWHYDSERILAKLGESAVEPELARDLGRLFLTCAMTRVDSAWTFWRRFSLVRDAHPSPLRRAFHHVFRAVPVFYFFWLISISRRGRPPADRDRLRDAFARVQRRLPTDGSFLDGARPGTADYQLFGIVQMCATLPGRPIDVLLHAAELEALRDWAERMQARFTDYDRLYTAQLFAPRSAARASASPFEQALFWFGAVLCWLLAPIGVPAVFYYAGRIRKKGYLPDTPPAAPSVADAGN